MDEKRIPREVSSQTFQGARLRGVIAGYKHSALETFLLWILPTLAVLGSLAPVSGPFFAFRAAVPLAIVASVLTDHGGGKRSAAGIRKLILSFCWLWFMAMAVLSLFATRTPALWTEVLSITIGLLLIAATALFADIRYILWVWTNGWLGAYLLVMMIVVWEVSTGSHLPNYFVYQSLDIPAWTLALSPAATLGNPNNLAFFLLASMIVLLSGPAFSTSKNVRTLFTVSAFSIPVLLVFTGSRTAVVAITGAAIVFLFFYRPLVGLLATICALICSAIISVVNVSLFAQLPSIVQGWFGDFIGGQSGNIRVNLVLNGLDFLADTALAGTGPGGFQEHMARGGRYATQGITSPHNGAVEVLVQYGVVVFVALLFLLVAFAIIAVRAYRRSASGSSTRQLAATLILALILILPMVVLNSTTIAQSFPWVYFAFLTAIAIFLASGDEGPRSTDPRGHILSGEALSR